MFDDGLVYLITEGFKEVLYDDVKMKLQCYPDIPEKSKSNVLKHFVKPLSKDETILLIFDTTMFGSGKNGMVFTDEAVYYKEILEDTAVAKYTDWKSGMSVMKKLGVSDESPIYKVPEFNKLMRGLSAYKNFDGDLEEARRVASEKYRESRAEYYAKKEAEKAEKEAQKAASKSGDKEAEKAAGNGKGTKDVHISNTDVENVLNFMEFLVDVLTDPSRM